MRLKIAGRFNGKRLGDMAESMLSYAVFRRQYLSEVKRVRRHEHNAAWEGNPRGKASVAQGRGWPGTDRHEHLRLLFSM